MITWSNIVAVVIGMAFIYWLYKISDYGNPFIAAFMSILWFFSLIIFYAIWGGIFWW
nr:MAG: hypothetical protein [Bacteriophage sp.]